MKVQYNTPFNWLHAITQSGKTIYFQENEIDIRNLRMRAHLNVVVRLTPKITPVILIKDTFEPTGRDLLKV